MFSLRMVARPDARMVEVPLELEAQLPQEFEGAAVLASSGVPRKVRLKTPKDAVRLSTAYRADQLIADVVKSTLQAPAAEVQRIQDAAKGFLRSVRERRQTGASFIVRMSGSGALEVSESGSEGRGPSAPGRGEGLREAAESRVAALEAALSKVTATGERLSELERRLQQLEERVARASVGSDVAGPGLERRGTAAQEAVRPLPARRSFALDAFADGIRAELRGRLAPVLAEARASAEIATRAAALAAEARLLLRAPGVDPQPLQRGSAAAEARHTAAERVLEELDLCGPAELALADRLVPRLEAGPETDPLALLEPVARAVVGSAAEPDGGERRAWLERAATLGRWTLIEPERGMLRDPSLHDAVGEGEGPIAEVVCAGLQRGDGSLLAAARVRAGINAARNEESRAGTGAGAEPAALREAALTAADSGAALAMAGGISPSGDGGGALPDPGLEGVAPVEELEVSDADVEEVLELGHPAEAPSDPRREH